MGGQGSSTGGMEMPQINNVDDLKSVIEKIAKETDNADRADLDALIEMIPKDASGAPDWALLAKDTTSMETIIARVGSMMTEKMGGQGSSTGGKEMQSIESVEDLQKMWDSMDAEKR